MFLQDRLTLWRSTAWEDQSIRWREDHLLLGFCRQCRQCCAPQPKGLPVHMALLDWQLKEENRSLLTMLDEKTALLDSSGCTALGVKGCRLSYKLRPVCCSIYPFTLLRGRLYLSTLCPAVYFIPLIRWYEISDQVVAWLERFSLSDQRRISCDYPDAVLESCFFFLKRTLFA